MTIEDKINRNSSFVVHMDLFDLPTEKEPSGNMLNVMENLNYYNLWINNDLKCTESKGLSKLSFH